MAYVVGVTGGIGSGKSTVADLFARRGAAVLDTDRVAHSLTQPHGAAMASIRAQFGESYIANDGSLDRARMRQLVFAEPAAKRSLEAILHPLIRDAVKHWLEQVSAPYALLLIPLLVETGGYRGMLDRVLVIDCDEEVQIARTMARSQLTRAQVQAIMASQASREERLAIADDVIDNSGLLESLGPRIDELHRLYRVEAHQKARE